MADDTLTAPELKHLLGMLDDAVVEGSYYGNREQYWKRHERIQRKLIAMLIKCEGGGGVEGGD